MSDDVSLDAVLGDGYGFEDDAVVFGRALDPELESTLNDHLVQVPLRSLNRHGLVAGATGTGKTKTLHSCSPSSSRVPGSPSSSPISRATCRVWPFPRRAGSSSTRG